MNYAFSSCITAVFTSAGNGLGSTVGPGMEGCHEGFTDDKQSNGPLASVDYI